jgi:hypothetical protein
MNYARRVTGFAFTSPSYLLALSAKWRFAATANSGDSMNQNEEYGVRASQLSQEQIDLALLFMSDFHVNGRSLYRIQGGRPFWVRYEADGRLQERSYFSALSWRALMLFALEDCREFKAIEMGEPGRLSQLFSEAAMQRLEENAKACGDVVPVLKLIDPKGPSTVIIARSRCKGHAVDALHTLDNGRPVFQPVWVSDLLRLDAKIGMRLALDETFAPTMPIGSYIEAAALTGRIVEEDELSILPLTGNVPRLRSPEPSPTVQRIFDHQCRKYPELEKLRGRTIYEDYGFEYPNRA